jgi:hypothetical protein
MALSLPPGPTRDSKPGRVEGAGLADSDRVAPEKKYHAGQGLGHRDWHRAVLALFPSHFKFADRPAGRAQPAAEGPGSLRERRG